MESDGYDIYLLKYDLKNYPSHYFLDSINNDCSENDLTDYQENICSELKVFFLAGMIVKSC